MTITLVRRALLVGLLILAGLLFASLLVIGPGRTAGQAGGNVQLATAVQNLTFVMAATSTNKPITANIGQVGHEVVYQFGSPGTGCAFFLDGSTDNSHWNTLATGGDTGLTSAVDVASGYFPFLRIKANALNNPACLGKSLTVNYTGSQIPLPGATGFTAAATRTSVSTPALMLCGLGVPVCQAGTGTPYVFGGILCFNSGAAIAYLQVYDSLNSPTLNGSGFLTVPIAINANYTYTGPAINFSQNIWLAGTTTATGSTGVAANTLACALLINGYGPFEPLFPPSALAGVSEP